MTAPSQAQAGDDARFEQQFKRAQAVIDRVVDKFIATAFFYPMLQQIDDSPFKTERFSGGFTEDVFRSRLNLRLADEISASTDLDVAKVLTDYLVDWLKKHKGKVGQVADMKGIDAVG